MYQSPDIPPPPSPPPLGAFINFMVTEKSGYSLYDLIIVKCVTKIIPVQYTNLIYSNYAKNKSLDCLCWETGVYDKQWEHEVIMLTSKNLNTFIHYILWYIGFYVYSLEVSVFI